MAVIRKWIAEKIYVIELKNEFFLEIEGDTHTPIDEGGPVSVMHGVNNLCDLEL